MQVGMGIGIPFNRRRQLSAVEDLFYHGEMGGNLVFSDFSTEWQDSAGTTPYTAVEQYVGKIVDKSPNALAFTQATSAARPVVSARVNLVVASENPLLLTGTDGTASITSDSTGDRPPSMLSGNVSKGTSTNTTISSAYQYNTGIPVVQNGKTTRSFFFKPLANCASFSFGTSTTDLFYASVNLTTGVVTNGAYSTGVATQVGNGWWLLTSTCNRPDLLTASTSIFIVAMQKVSNAVACTWFSIGYDSRPASRSSLPYQRINTSTDYDTVGFPYYAKFDSIDDNIVSAAGGGGTAGIYYCGAIQFNKVGTVQTIFSDTGTNSGYKLQLTAANQLQLSAGNGTAFTAINTTDVFVLRDVSLCELWDDGTNLGVRLGEGTPVTVARPVVTAGTAQITLGKDNSAASNYAGIGMFEPVWRYGAMPNTTQREAIRAICRSKAGIA